jgi:hypothetical protein
MMRFALVVLLFGFAGAAKADPSVAIPAPNAPDQAVAPAQSVPPPGADENGRFSFHRTGDMFVRLDAKTGEVAQCDSSAGVWSCKLVPDERAALEAEIARLQRENVALKKSLLAKGVDLPPGVVAEAPAAQADRPVPPANVPDATPQPPKAPSEAELDRAIAYMKNVWRKLVDMMLDLQRDVQRRS